MYEVFEFIEILRIFVVVVCLFILILVAEEEKFD